MNEKGFTLIELIVIIVILGILAVTAIPKYVDMRTDARVAAADGVFGAAQGAATMNFAATLLNKPVAERPAVGAAPCAAGLVTEGQCLLNAMEETPEGWIISGATPNTVLCPDADGDGTCDDIDNDGTNDSISVTTAETETPPAKAILAKSW